MEGFSSECSSGCESGWTMYLDHSGSPNHFKRDDDGFVDEGGFLNLCEDQYKAKYVEEEEGEEEDLSMVSDASSGPPHLHDDEEYYYRDQYGCFYSASSSATTTALAKKSDKRQKIKLSSPTQHQSLLDDTASSPLFNFPKSNFTLNSQQASRDISQGFSATHFKGRSAFQKHFGYFESSMPGKPTSAKPVVCRKDSGNRRW